jgi:ABC-2 type transport system permease protein
MPWAIQAVTYFIPARYFLEGLRAIMVKGVGAEAYWEQLLALAIFAAILLIGSAVRLKRGGLAA